MSERLLRKSDIAAMLGTSPGVTASILSKHGCHPIDFGYGRARGPRWLESAVKNVLLSLHLQAQPEIKESKNYTPKMPKLNMANMKTRELQGLLTMSSPLQ